MFFNSQGVLYMIYFMLRNYVYELLSIYQYFKIIHLFNQLNYVCCILYFD